MGLRWSDLLFAVVILAVASTAHALPVAQYSGYVQVTASTNSGITNSPQNLVTGAGTYSEVLTGFHGDTASSQVVVSTGPVPSLTATGVLSTPAYSGPGNDVASAYGPVVGGIGPGVSFTYFLEITGPTGMVPIDVNAMVAASSSVFLPGGEQGGEITVAAFSVGPTAGACLFCGVVYLDNRGASSNAYTLVKSPSGVRTMTPLVYSPTTGLYGTVNESVVWMAQTNFVYAVTLFTSNSTMLSGSGTSGGQMNAYARVDPTFHLDSSVANPDLYTIVLSDGIGNGQVITPVSAVEYYNASQDHYFMTWIPNEIAILDAGVQIKGWARTGYSFNAYAMAQSGTSPVCRFYIPPDEGDSHFYGRGSAECTATGAAHPDFVLEDPDFMNMFLPVAGTCPPNTAELYRVFDNRPDANHRYMTDKSVRDQMVAKGWIAEGDGPDLVVMCAPQ